MNDRTDAQLEIPGEEVRQQISALIYESCMALNAEHWHAFLALCDTESFRYRITNYSPEIRREQCWMDRDFAGLKSLIELLPKHNSDHSPLTRHGTVYRIGRDPASGDVLATTQVAIYRTQLDGCNSHFESGQTHLFAIGRYEDRIRPARQGNAARLLSRNVVLDTRQIDIGSHVPF